MQNLKPVTTKASEGNLSTQDNADIRQMMLENAKKFKTSWISFGQALYTVWKDKLYRKWGYEKFETYTAKEIGIRKQTAIKLLRSYYFMEREEPLYLQKDYNNQADAALVPTYESIDVLRLARDKKNLNKEDYTKIKKSILEMGKDYSSAKKDLTALIRQREELQPEEAWQKKRAGILKRLLSVLKSIVKEARQANMLSAKSLDEIENIANRIETEGR
jgi:hypothetical protein